MSGPNEIDIYIGQRIRRIREFRGFKRDVAAAALDVSTTEVGLIERGLRRLSPEQILVISRVLRVRPSYLFSNIELKVDEEYASALLPLYEDLVGKIRPAKRSPSG